MIFRAVNAVHTVPGIALATKYQTAVIPGISRVFRIEILESRGIFRRNPPFIIKDYSLSAPVPLPIILGIEVKDLRPDLALGIAVR